jgi:hypothetical protein
MQPMTREEAERFGLESHRSLVRMDHAKGNYVPSADDAFWMKFHNIELDNASDEQPVGDHVGVLKIWYPPKALDGIAGEVVQQLLDAIDAGMEDGERYALEPRTKGRWVAHIIAEIAGINLAQAARIAHTWGRSGLLIEREYYSESRRKTRSGIWVDEAKRPDRGSTGDTP